MKSFGTDKTWEEDIEDFKTFYDAENEIDIIQIEKNSLITFIHEIIKREMEIHQGFTGI